MHKHVAKNVSSSQKINNKGHLLPCFLKPISYVSLVKAKYSACTVGSDSESANPSHIETPQPRNWSSAIVKLEQEAEEKPAVAAWADVIVDFTWVDLGISPNPQSPAG